ncbi:MAG: LamG domain-containing protein [Cellvibrionaceae bacterium]
MKNITKIFILCINYFLILFSSGASSAPGDILYENYFNSTLFLTSDFDRSSIFFTSVNSDTFDSPSSSAFFYSGPQSITLKSSKAINANVPSAELAIWVRRGSDSFSEDPDEDEDFIVEYLSDTNNWEILETFTGEGDPGEIFDRVYDLPSDALYDGLRLRFRTLNSNLFFDYWHLDDVVVTETQPPTTLLAHWQLEELSWNGGFNQVLDASGNNLHGFTAAPIGNHPSPERTDPAIAFPDGTCGYGNFEGANGGFVQINDPGGSFDLDLPDSLTVTVWIQPRSIPSSDLQTIVSKDENFEFHLNTAGQIFWWWGGGVQSLGTSGTPLQTDGTWYHVAITYQDGEQKIYIDGVERGSNNATGTLTLNDDPVLIGTDLGFNSRTFNGLIDEVKIYSGALTQTQVQNVMAETHICPIGGIDHYGISYDGGVSYGDSTGITCDASNVTIVAHDASHAEITPGTGTSLFLTTSTSNGYWSSADVGSVVDTGSGSATYTFANNSKATLRFNHTVVAVNPSPVNFNINAANSDPTEIVGEDPNIEFFDTGFRFVDGSDNAVIGNQIAAQQSSVYSLQAIRTDTQTGQCINVFGNGDQADVEIAAECTNPTSCAGLQVSITNNGNTNTISTNNDNSGAGAASYSTFGNLLFGVDSKAAFTLTYPDAGAISLHARYQILNDDSTPSGRYMSGSSNSFVVSPADFVITAVDAGVVSNPSTTNTGTGFVASGDPFRVLVEARNAAGNITPNFGNEITPETVELNVDSLVFPVGGMIGSLINPAAFSLTANSGELENTAITWNEVGAFATVVSIGDGDYLGAGDVVGTTSTTIGRFYPAYFSLQSSSVNNSCSSGSFSYFSDNNISVSYEIVAHNRLGNTVSNYDNTDLDYPTATQVFHGENNNTGNDFNARLTIASSQWDDGELLVVDSNANVARLVDGSSNTIPDGPYTNFLLAVEINDIDDANFDTLNFKADETGDCVANGNCDSRELSGALNMRFGRLSVLDVHGPETSAIPMIWQTEFWNGSSFVLNTEDSCTQLPLIDVNFVGASSLVDAANDVISVDLGGSVSVFDFSDVSGMLDCMSSTHIGMCRGKAGITYGATGQVATYPIDIDLSSHLFLQGDWNQDGNYNDSLHPRIYVRFQNYRGHDRVIYWQENFE